MRLNLLSLQPALRTLTSDYNCVKKQVQDFPFMLDKAISEAKQEVGDNLLLLLLLQVSLHFELLFQFLLCVCVYVSDLSGDQRGEQCQSGTAEEIQARDEPEEEMSQRAGPTQRSVCIHCITH